MWGQHNQQQPPPGGPPLYPDMPPPQETARNSNSQQANTHQTGIGYGNGDESDQTGSALNSAVDMVTSAASNIFAYGRQQQQQHQQQAPPPMNNPQIVPPQQPSPHHPPRPIQPTSSLLSTPVQQPAPIQVDSSLLSTATAAPRPPMQNAPVRPVVAVNNAGPPPLSAAAGPPPMQATTTTSSGPPPLSAAGPPPTQNAAQSTASSGPPKPTAAAATAPPVQVQNNPFQTPATKVSGPGTPQQITSSRPTASISPRSKKLPLPPPPTTRKPRPATKSKFKLPPTYKSTTPTSTPSSTKEKVSLTGMLSSSKSTTTRSNTATPEPKSSSGADATGAPLMPSTPSMKPAISDATPKQSNVGLSPTSVDTPMREQQQIPMAMTMAMPEPAPVPTTLPSGPPLTEKMTSSKQPPTQVSPETAAAAPVPAPPPAAAMPQEETSTIDSTAEAPLRPGWIELVDDSSGRKYYFNEQKGQTTWERPIVETTPVDETKVQSAPPQTDAVEETPAPAPRVDQPETAAEVDNQLPDGWVEVVDEASGSTYYVNKIDNTTTWSRPTMSDLAMDSAMKQPSQPEQAPEEKQEVAPAPEQQEQEQEETENAQDVAPLPPGWMELKDEASGRSYYVNQADNTTTWERPVSTSDAAEEKPEAVGEEKVDHTPELTRENSFENVNEDMMSSPTNAADTTMGILEDLQEEEPPLPEGWREAMDPDSGRKFYFNEAENSRTWERPVVPAEVQPSQPAQTEEENAVAPEVAGEKEEKAIAPELTESVDNNQDATDVKRGLPPGWIEATDPLSGRPYYFNEETNEASWDPPASAPKENSNEEEEEEESDGYVMVESQNENDDAAPESTHELDTNNDQEEKTESQGEIEGGVTLAPGWEELTDPSTGKPYYVNIAQNRTVWEKPLLETASILSSAPDVAGAGAELAPEFSQVEEEQVDAAPAKSERGGESTKQESETVAADAEANEASPLPPGWEEMHDPATNTTFYYNEAEDKSSWERPVALPDSVPEKKAPVRHTTMDELKTAPGESELDITESSDPNEEAKKVAGEISGPTDEVMEEENPPSDLPRGWIASTDPLSGCVFYFNQVDGTSSWEKPVVETDAHGEIPGTDKNDVADENLNNPEVTALSDDKESKHLTGGSEGDLPPGWITVDDPSTGKVFYFNEAEKITSWEKPAFSDREGGNKHGNSVAPAPVDAPLEHAEKPEPTIESSVQGGDIDLPPGWSASVDPASGKPFYFNEATGESSWEMPATQTGEEIEVGTTAADLSQKKEPAVDGGTEDESEEAPQPESADTALEQQPEESQPAKGSSIPGEETELPPGSSIPGEETELPPGWVESVDPASGRPFYYNESTVESSWERPTVQAEEVQEQTAANIANGNGEPVVESVTENEEDTQTSVSKTAETRQPEESEPLTETGAPQEESVLPPGWVESVDPASGRPFYYNESSGESSWERPTVQAEEAEKEPADVPTEMEEQVVESITETVEETAAKGTADAPSDQLEDPQLPAETNVPEGEPVLPLGWVESVDPASGNPFYFNESTQESSWERPIVPPEEVQEEVAGVTEEPVAGRVTQTEVPGSLPEAVDTPLDQQLEDPRPAAETNILQEELDLPSGWVQSIDPDSGNPFYFNETTQESSWERPSIFSDLKEEITYVESAEGELATGVEEPAAETVAEDEGPELESKEATELPLETPAQDELDTDLPPGWVVALDPSSGSTYYYNEIDNESSWEKPKKMIPEQTNVNAASANADVAPTEHAGENDQQGEEPPVSEKPDSTSDELPPNWEEVVDPTTGDIYYCNRVEDKTSWERPSPEESPVQQQEDASAENVDETLPEGWEEVESDDGVYYYNPGTGETQWERPVASAQSIPEHAAAATKKTEATLKGPRPGHAFATFGFGGKLCIWRSDRNPQQNRPVEIHRTRDLIPQYPLVQSEAAKEQLGFSGPLDGVDSHAVLAYVKEQSQRKPKDILWQLLGIVAAKKGKLRSEAGVSDSSSPETALVDLLLREGPAVSEEPLNGMNDLPGPIQSVEEDRNGDGKSSCRSV